MPSDGYFDAAVAQHYDADHPPAEPAMLERLVQLAAGGPVLEFAIGTGRIALPLKARGLEIKGIELSQAMVAALRDKETGTPLEIVIGDMSCVRMPGAFNLVILAFNTIDNLTTQEAQIACFQNAARHLASGGRFVIEAQVPPVQHVPFGTTTRAFACSDDHWGIETIDIATQSHVSHHLWRDGESLREYAIPFRYAWPAEMDLMARMAGLTLETRHSDWVGTAFTHESRKHISVWRAPF